MDLLLFTVGLVIFVLYLACLVFVINSQNKIQEKNELDDPELKNH
jgi:hypothetical protein